MAKDLITCPHCSVEVGREELRRNHLCCPTCGFDMSEARLSGDEWNYDGEQDDEFTDDKDNNDASDGGR